MEGNKANPEAQEYNPFEHRQVKKPNSDARSLANLIKSSLGSGILAVPLAFANSGWAIGIVGTIIIAFICGHCVHIFPTIENGIYILTLGSLYLTRCVQLILAEARTCKQIPLNMKPYPCIWESATKNKFKDSNWASPSIGQGARGCLHYCTRITAIFHYLMHNGVLFKYCGFRFTSPSNITRKRFLDDLGVECWDSILRFASTPEQRTKNQ